MTEQVPPHDEAAELSVLGTVLLAFDKTFPAVATLAIFRPRRSAM